MKNKLNKVLSRRAVAYLIVACTSVLFYVLLNNFDDVRKFFVSVWDIFMPFISGVVIAYLLNPIVRFFEDKLLGRMKARHAAHVISVVATVLLALVFIGLVFYFILPQLFQSISKLVTNLEGYFNALKGLLSDLNERLHWLDINVEEVIGTWSSLFSKVVGLAKNNLTDIVDFSLKFGTGLFNSLIVLVMSVYILIDRDRITRGLERYKKALLPEKWVAPFDSFCKKSNRIILNFYGMNLVDAMIIGVLNFILMSAFGMEYSLLISVIVGLTNFIPSFGPIIGAVPSALLLVLVNPLHALIFLIFTVVLQTIDPYVIKPLLFKGGTGLTSVEVLLSIVLFGRLAGITGMLIGVPAFAILSMIVEYFISARLAKKEAADAAATEAPKSDEE